MDDPDMEFSYRVALALGWFNVDAMLETAAPGQLNKWKQFFKKQPFGDEWERTSLLITELVNTLQCFAMGFSNANLSDKQIKDRMLPRDFYMPKFKDEEGNELEKPLKQTNQVLSTKEIRSLFRARLGG